MRTALCPDHHRLTRQSAVDRQRAPVCHVRPARIELGQCLRDSGRRGPTPGPRARGPGLIRPPSAHRPPTGPGGRPHQVIAPGRCRGRRAAAMPGATATLEHDGLAAGELADAPQRRRSPPAPRSRCRSDPGGLLPRSGRHGRPARRRGPCRSRPGTSGPATTPFPRVGRGAPVRVAPALVVAEHDGRAELQASINVCSAGESTDSPAIGAAPEAERPHPQLGLDLAQGVERGRCEVRALPHPRGQPEDRQLGATEVQRGQRRVALDPVAGDHSRCVGPRDDRAHPWPAARPCPARTSARRPPTRRPGCSHAPRIGSARDQVPPHCPAGP